MRKYKKRSLKELVMENKRELLRDQVAMDAIEERIVQRAQAKFMQ